MVVPQQVYGCCEDADTSPSSKRDINGLRFAPSCIAKCFIGDKICAHKNWFNVELNHVGDNVAFPTVWWHHGICNIHLRNKIFYTAQLFATPCSDLASNERSLRKSSKMKQHTEGTLKAPFLHTLMTDLYINWDEESSATKSPPAKKFFGDIERHKNRHILSDQIHKLPKIQRLVLAIEEKVGDITVDSVWLIKKTIANDGFQEWHQDFKHKITKTIEVNVSVVSTDENTVEVCVVNEDDLFRFPKQSCNKDDNGVILAPSCVTGCYVQGCACNHDKIKLQLNEVGDYVMFPSLWWHCGYCDIAAKTSNDHSIFTAQFFATLQVQGWIFLARLPR
jgi:hypothetical protein